VVGLHRLNSNYTQARYGLPKGSAAHEARDALVALAERHDAREIATLDHRHFSVVRPKLEPVQGRECVPRSPQI
jgi:hypothetical protein